MLLKTVANPYANGLPTRSVMYKPNPTQTFAIDAEQLHKNPRLLNAFGRGRGIFIRSLDVIAYLIGFAGLIASFLIMWWLFLPGFTASAAMLMANRKVAGTMARTAAARSNAHFLYLHEQRALWLVPQPSTKMLMSTNQQKAA